MSNNTKTETKTTTDSSSTGRAEMPNPFAAFASFDPMAMWSQSQQMWQKAFTDAFGRAQTCADQYAAMESQMLARAHGAVANWAQLAHDAINYGAQLSAEARKISFETARKMSAGA